MGHGRTATVSAALLMAKGLASDAREALRMVQAVRPKAKANRYQRRLLGQVAAALKRV
jgi:protein-tyrosine phosphatase